MTEGRAALAAHYGVELPYPPDQGWPPGEVFPKREAIIVRQNGGRSRLEAMSWGFPLTTRGASGKVIEKPVTNVRNYASTFWRSALANPERRCLVPFTAFSEYGQQRGLDGKLPLHWFNIPSRPIASFAGVWRPIDRGAVFAFLTTEPNAIVAPIHPKAMPVILHDEDEARWLSAPLDEALTLAAPFPAQLMRVDGERS